MHPAPIGPFPQWELEEADIWTLQLGASGSVDHRVTVALYDFDGEKDLSILRLTFCLEFRHQGSDAWAIGALRNIALRQVQEGLPEWIFHRAEAWARRELLERQDTALPPEP